MVRKTFFLTVTAFFFGFLEFTGSSITDQDFQENFDTIETLLATSPTERCDLITKVLEQQKAAELLIQAAQLTIKAFQLIEAPDVQEYTPTTTPLPTTKDASLEAKVGNTGGSCSKLEYPYFNDQCVNVSGIQNPCKDIRECDFVDTILALGGWPTICGWVEDGVGDSDRPKQWPKVCCGMPLSIGEPLKQEFVHHMIKKPSSTPTVVKEEEIKDNRIEEVMPDAPERKDSSTVRCVLPLVPQPDTSVTPADGVRFGNTPYSRQEFSKDSAFMYSLMHDSIFSMEFKTSGDSGVMFYISTGSNRPDYIGLLMQDGKLVFVFECGMGSAVISSQNTYNDGKWHRVVFLRQAQKGELVIDDQEEVKGKSPGIATRVDDLNSPLYVGGLSDQVAPNARANLQGISSSFPGCIRNVEAQGDLLTPEILSGMTNVTDCSSQVEDGTFFSVDGGYLVLQEKYRVGQQISISFDIKARNLSGVLIAVHGKEDYLILQLIDGSVEFTVDNGAGPITTTYTPGGMNNLCDGRFHTLTAESKSNNFVTLSVDGVTSEKSLDVNGVSSTDTFDPLYIGGLSESSWSKSGVRTTVPFVGCMRNLELNDKPQSMAQSRLVGGVTLNTCPTT